MREDFIENHMEKDEGESFQEDDIEENEIVTNILFRKDKKAKKYIFLVLIIIVTSVILLQSGNSRQRIAYGVIYPVYD